MTDRSFQKRNAQSALRPTVLDGVTYKIAGTQDERKAAFKLVYDSYVEAGLMGPTAVGMRVTPWHLLPTTDVFVAMHNDEVVYTMSLISDDKLGVPLESIYPDEVRSARDGGGFFAEVSCLASRNEYFDRTKMFDVFVRLVGLMFQYARFNDVDQLMIAVHPRHFRFYRRFLGFKQFGGLRQYECVKNNPAVACGHDFAALDETGYKLQSKIYQHRFDRWELIRKPMLPEERDYLATIVDVDSRPLAAVS